MSLHDDKIVDCFDLFRGIITEDGFQNELVIVLIIEASQKGFLLHELAHSLIIVVDDRVLFRGLVLKNKEPIESENLTVKNIAIINHLSHRHLLLQISPLVNHGLCNTGEGLRRCYRVMCRSF